MKLRLFGGFQLFDDADNPVALNARKAKALLAWLALHQDKTQPRDRLAALLWEESDDAQARHSLRQALSGLRKALGHQAKHLVSDQESILLSGGRLWVDALEFQKLLSNAHGNDDLQQAVALYGGEFLEGFNPRSDTYEEWLTTQRSHYREQAVGGMSALLDGYLETRQLEPGLRLAITLLSSDPLREQTHRTLMRLYSRLNRPAEALRQYRQCRRILFRELGLQPEPETERLYREISSTRSRAAKEPEVAAGGTGADPARGNAPLAVEGSEDQAATAVLPSDEKQQLLPVAVAHIHLGRYRTLLSAGDPEQLHRQTQALLQQVEGLTQLYGGRLHLQHNDAMVVLFGLPGARGNECEKAVQLAQALRDHCLAQPANPAATLGIQVGIASGQVICDGGNAVAGAVFSQAEQLARAGGPGDALVSETVFRGLRLPIEARQRDDGYRQIIRVVADGTASRHATPFVGRSRELRQFTAALEAAIEDQAGETFLLRAEAGIGKSRLVEEIGRQAEQTGNACHKALVLDFGMESQTEPIPSLLRGLLSIDDPAAADTIESEVRACLGDQWDETLHQHALHSLFHLPLSGRGLEPPGGVSEEARRIGSRQILHGILQARTRLQPRLLVVEDIHWADRKTLSLLAELAVAVSRSAALLIVTSRVEGEPLDPEWRSAMHGAPLTTLDLGPLRREQALSLAEHLAAGKGGFIDRCIERSGGNPFFLEQLLLSDTADDKAIPDSVQSLVQARLAPLSAADRMAVRSASVLGQRFSLRALRSVLGDNHYQADALLNQRLVRPDGNALLFAHALLREGLYAALLRSQRHRLHHRAADWYRERDPMLHARHLDLADDDGAAQAYLQAAHLAIRAFDFEQALALASRGVEICKDPRLGARLDNLRGELLIQAGAIDEANRAYQSAADQAGDEQSKSRALVGLATGLTVQDDLGTALRVLEQAAPMAQRCGDNALQTEIHYRRGDILFALARTDECLSAHQAAAHLAKRAEAPLLEIRALAGLADAYYGRGQMKTANGYFDRCIELARQENRLPQELGNLAMRGLTRFYNGSVNDALADEIESAELAARYGNLRAEMSAYMNRALVNLYTEEIDGAEQAARRGLELAQQLGAGRFFGDNLASIGEALVLKGQVAEGIDYLERAYQSALDTVPTHTAAFILGVLARVTPDEQRRQQAIAEGERLLDQGSLSHNHLHFYQNLIEVCLNKGDSAGALHYADALAAYTRAEPLPWSDFYIARGRLLADSLTNGVDEQCIQQARQLLAAAKAAGLFFGTIELQALVNG